jgi:hypothetical protein
VSTISLGHPDGSKKPFSDEKTTEFKTSLANVVKVKKELTVIVADVLAQIRGIRRRAGTKRA